MRSGTSGDVRGAWIRATLIGTILQLAMVLAGHLHPAVATLFAPLGVGISAVAGFLFARAAGAAAGASIGGGALAGGICALIGIVVSYLLGDVEALILLLGTASSAVGGALGGWIGGALGRRAAIAGG